ncbi:hypothetical protein CVT26_006962, partial [Gymnopilus dilepis]
KDARRTNRRSHNKTPVHVPSTPPAPDPRPPKRNTPAPEFHIYRFETAMFPSLEAPVRGIAGPVEEIMTVSYPGDDMIYSLDDGYVVPPALVQQHDLYNRARRLVEEERALRPPSPPEVPFPSCGQPPRARSPSPEILESELEPEPIKLKVWPPRRQGKPYVLVPANPYVIKPGRMQSSGKGKGVARAIEEIEESAASDNDHDEDFVPDEDDRNRAYMAETTISEFSQGDYLDPIEDPDLTRDDASMSIDNREESRASAVDKGLDVEPLCDQLFPSNLTCQLEEADIQFLRLLADKSGEGLYAISPERKVESARRLMQVIADWISQVDQAIQIFGGVNYGKPSKTGSASHTAAFISSNDFVQSQQIGRGAAQTAGSVASLPTKANTGGVALLPAGFPAPLQEGGAESEAPHVLNFHSSDPRKRGRNYLSLTYRKVDPRRCNVDWINIILNSIKYQFRLENCSLSPHPGETDFVAEKVPAKQWQEIGNLLTAHDFHPEEGGRNPRAARFASWTSGTVPLLLLSWDSFKFSSLEEKQFKKGSKEYRDIPIIVDPKGEPLLSLRQAELLMVKSQSTGVVEIVSQEEVDDGKVNGREAQALPGKDFQKSSQAVLSRKDNGVVVSNVRQAAPKAVTPHPAFNKITPPVETNPYPNRPPPRTTTTTQQKKKKDDATLQNPGHPLPQPALAPGATSVGSFSRDLPYRGELGSGQHRKLVYAAPTHAAPTRLPPVASATRAFYGSSVEPPPSDRGLSYVKPRPKARAQQGDTAQAGSSRDPGSSKHHAS